MAPLHWNHLMIPPTLDTAMDTVNQFIRKTPPTPQNNNNNKVIPKPFQKSDDPNVWQQAVYQTKNAIVPGPEKTAFRTQLDRMQFDPATRAEIRRRFQATEPWTVVPTSAEGQALFPDPVDNSHESMIGMVWQALKEATGYVLFTYQDLFRYFDEYRKGEWTWSNLVKDAAFLWRLTVTALITMGLLQMTNVVDSLLRLTQTLVGIVVNIFQGTGNVIESVWNTIQQSVL